MSGNISMGSISKAANSFNKLKSDEIVVGIKTAANLYNQVKTAEIQQNDKLNTEKNEIPIPTAADIRKAYNEGEYTTYKDEEYR